MGVMRAAAPITVYNNDGTSEYKNNGLSFMGDISFVFLTDRLNTLYGITDILGYTDAKGNKNIKWNATSDSTIGGSAAGDIVYLIRQSDLPAVPPQNYKELVQKTADAYRKKSGTTAQVSVSELPDKIRSLKVEGGVPPNGREWKQSNINTGTFTHICCGENGVWVAGLLWDNLVDYYGIYYSLDGKNWTLSNVIGDEIASICYGNGIFVAVGTNMYYSNDGMTWIQNGPSDCLKIEYSDGIWITGNRDNLFYSFNGINWKDTEPTSNQYPTVIYYANNMWIVGIPGGVFLWSHNGINWSSCNLDTRAEAFLSVFYNDDYWITADAEKGEIFKSLDGIDWEYAGDAAPTYSIIYENGIWIFATSAGIYFSDDDITTVEPSNVRNEEVYFVNYANGIFIALGQYNIYYSLDGIKWTKSNEVSSKILVSAYLANGIWVAGTGNGLYYSLASFDRYPEPLPKDTSWATANDDTITSMLAEARAGKINLEDYWKVGDTRKITLDNKSYSGSAGSMTTSNEEVELVLAEPLSVSTSYGAKNGFIVTMKNCLKTDMMMNLNGTNTGSFAGSDMCAFLNDGTDGFLGMLPDWLANNLLTANVKTADPYNGTTIKTTQHKIFLPTEREIFGVGYEGYEGYSNNTEAKLAELKHWKYYQTTSNRVKQVNGRDSYWWERSPNGYHSNLFCVVRSYGIADVSDADVPSGVAPCFCIGTPPAKSITASVSTVSGASYGFKKNSNGYFESQNKGYHSTAALCKLTITVTGSYNVSLDCINYAESNYDFGLISTKNGTLSTSYTEDSNVLKSFKGLSQSGVQNISLGTLKDETATFYIKFRKDTSGNNYNDSLQWKLKADGNIVNI